MTTATEDQSSPGRVEPIPPDEDDQLGYQLKMDSPKKVKLTLWGVFLFLVVVFVLGWWAGYSWGISGENIQNDKEAHEVERQTAERELRYYAEANDLPVANIRVTREGDKLVASWQQGNQTCDVEAIPPSGSNKLWSTKPVKEGSGDCLTKTGSAGINSGG